MLTGALLAALPAAVAAAESPIDPTLPTPTLATATHCGSETDPAWEPSSTSPSTGMSVYIGIPQPTVNGVQFQGVVHAWDVDGSQSADGSVDRLPELAQSVWVPLPLVDGHTYAWYASTYDGTAYSNPTQTCYFTVDASPPVTPEVTNPDFPRAGDPGTPTKAAGQPTTFTFSAADTLPNGCIVAGTPDCQASGLDHFAYGVDQEPGIGAAQVAADSEGRGSLTTSFSWGVHTLYVVGVDAAGNRTQAPAAYTFDVPWQLPAPTALSVSAPSSVVPGRAFRVTGLLASSSPLDPGQTLSIGRNGDPFTSVSLAADGSFSFTDTATAEGTITYSVSYPGDATHAPSSAFPAVTASKLATSISTTAPSSATRAKALTVSGKLSGSPYLSGEVVTVVKTDLAHPSGYALTRAKVAADGSFTFSDTPQVGGTNSYKLSYAGDISHKAGGRVVTVAVTRSTPSLTLTTDRSTYSYGQTAEITAHLGTTYNNRKVTLYAGTTLLGTATVDSHGNVSRSYPLTHNTTFRVVFAGDYRYAPRTLTKSVGTYAKVSESQSGYYTSTHYGSTLYRVYHHTVKAQFNAAVAPNKAGQCLIFRLQKYYGGAWHTQATSSCHALSSTSTGYLKVSLAHGVNGRFRMVAGYVHSSKDNTNLSTWSAWQYFTVRS